jgi:hypothetical protein
MSKEMGGPWKKTFKTQCGSLLDYLRSLYKLLKVSENGTSMRLLPSLIAPY